MTEKIVRASDVEKVRRELDARAQGEFKKRITELSTENQCDAFDVGCDKVDPDEMLKMIDEAREDIFALQPYIGYYVNGEPVEVFNAKQTKEKLEKWLGDDKK